MLLYKRSIYIKLFLTYLLIIFGSFLIFGSSFFLLFQKDIKDKYQISMENQRDQIVSHLLSANENQWSQESVQSTLELLTVGGLKSIQLYNHDGSLLYRASQNDSNHRLEADIVNRALRGETFVVKEKINDEHVLIFGSPIKSSIEEQAIILMDHKFDRETTGVGKLFLIVAFITILFTSTCLYYVSKKITAPLRHMNQIVLEYAKGKFDTSVHIRSEDEIGQLGKSFNHMARELGRLDQSRKDFVANVSHDLRSPLTSINGFIKAMLDGTIPQERQNHYLKIMKDETERLIKLVNDLLDLASIESGQISFNPVGYNVSEQIRKVVAKMEPEFVKRNIEPRLFITNEEEVYVFADPDRIEQVLVNLIQNSVQFSERDTQIDILVSTEIGNKAIIQIKDQGKGIKRDDLPLVWKRFYKGDKARSEKVGTGIGLSIVKHVLELHEETIEMESELGQGTTLTFSLPLNNRLTQG